MSQVMMKNLKEYGNSDNESDVSNVLSKETDSIRSATANSRSDPNDLSDLLTRDVLVDIKRVVGSADVLGTGIFTGDIISPCTSPVYSRKRTLPQNNDEMTIPSTSNPFRVFRKGPSELNNRRIPGKEPRIRLEVSNEASPIRNIGNCQTPQRTRSRLPRNDSQNVATGSDDALDDITDMVVIAEIIEAFKEISEPNSLAIPKKETGGLLLGMKWGNK